MMLDITMDTDSVAKLDTLPLARRMMVFLQRLPYSL